MKMYPWITMLILAGLYPLFSACNESHQEIGRTEIRQAFIVNSSPTFQGYYYEGSDEQFHYFESRWKYGSDRRFKIKTSDLFVLKTFPVGKPDRQIFLFQSPERDVEIFAEFEEQKFYTSK